MSVEKFKRRVYQYAGEEFVRKSILKIRNGAGVIERILGDGKYKRILEIGSYRGVSSAYMAQFCEAVYTIDLVHGKMEQDVQVFDRVRFWEAMNIPNVNLRLVETEAEKSELIASLDFDFAFVDGDHEGDAPRRDFNMVKRCGAVLFHDYDGQNGVTQLIDSLPRHQVEIMDIFAFWRR